MNKYLKVLLSILSMVAIIGISYYAYGSLKDKYKMNQLSSTGGSENDNIDNNTENSNTKSSNAEDSNTENNVDDSNTEDNLPAESEKSQEEKEPIKAYDFTVVNMEDAKVTLSSMEGKPTVVNFWASWCGPCKSEMPEFQKLYEEFGEEVQFMMVNLTDGERETKSTATDFIHSEGYTFPVYFDENQEAANAYQVFSIPTTYFIDENGYFTAYSEGAMDEETLRKGIGMIYTK